MISKEQQRRLREAYEHFSRRALEENPAAKDEVDQLLRHVYTEARPTGAPMSAMPFVLTPKVDVELTDLPELANVWGALHEELPEVSPAYEAADAGLGATGLGPADIALRRRRDPESPPEVIQVLPDGGLLGTGRYQILDPNWIEAAICWLRHLFDKVDFNPQAPVVSIPNQTSMALLGDWGTGPSSSSRSAEQVADIVRRLQADYTMHLGDVYYSGTPEEVRKNFLRHWPAKERSFALNSNHEMYTRGKGLSGVTLKDPAFAEQVGASYFALENAHWVIVGLDTALQANPLRLYRRGKIKGDQLEFLRQRVAGLQGRKLMLLSHHQGLELEGKPAKNLWQQVQSVIPDGTEAVWYWGHLHTAAVYAPVDGIHGRCNGHGGMPRGRASVLEDNDQVIWFGAQKAGDPEVPPRVTNGMVYLHLDGPDLHEFFLDEHGEWVWHSPGADPANLPDLDPPSGPRGRMPHPTDQPRPEADDTSAIDEVSGDDDTSCDDDPARDDTADSPQ